MNVLIVIYVKVFLICILCEKSIYICFNIKTKEMELILFTISINLWYIGYTLNLILKQLKKEK